MWLFLMVHIYICVCVYVYPKKSININDTFNIYESLFTIDFDKTGIISASSFKPAVYLDNCIDSCDYA